jgi:hypothetical protein
MKPASPILRSLATALLLASSVLADADPKRALYSITNVLTAGSDKAWLEEMKVTAGQQKSLEATRERRNKIWLRYLDESEKVRKNRAHLFREMGNQERATDDIRKAVEYFPALRQQLEAGSQ